MLSTLVLKKYYRSDECNIVNEFYIPCMEHSILYQRAVGFFSSTSLSVAAKGLHSLIKHGGTMELVASPELSKEDVMAIQKGYSRRDLIERRLTEVFDNELSNIVKERLGFLAWLIESNRLEIKIATVDNYQLGMYHEKIGLFFDGSNYVAFSGSPNESSSGLLSNFESIDVYCSWIKGDRDRAEIKKSNFSKLWNNQTKNLTVFSFPEAAKNKLINFKPALTPIQDPENSYSCDEHTGETMIYDSGDDGFFTPVKLRPYQEDALKNWFRANGKGTLKMATGSGKTITALAIAQKMYQKTLIDAIIIICPYKHLVSQWSAECERFGLKPIKCFESKFKWVENVENNLLNLDQLIKPLCVVTTNKTFSLDSFQRLLKFFPSKTMLIGDEVHNLGADSLFSALPERISYRLGLSATPERWFDEEGTTSIYNYFGSIIQPEFTLKDALNAGALVPYKYYPIFVHLTDEELDAYISISNKISKILQYQKERDIVDNSNSALTVLLSKRARLLGAAKNKLTALKELMKNRLDTTHTLFYCGDGSVEDDISEETTRQIEAVSKLLGYELGFRVDTYTAETPINEREDLRNQLNKGDLQGLVAIRCLDEGIDIPSIKTAVILASSSNPRQFIQRRGRILRPAPNKKQAEIYDMVILPDFDISTDLSIERMLFRKELKRYLEFANLALNAGEVRGKISAIQSKLGLHIN